MVSALKKTLKNKKLMAELCAAVVLLVCLFRWVFPHFLSAQNINTRENFPDIEFRRAAEQFMGVEKDGYFSEAQAAERSGRLSCPHSDIFNLKGIGFFTALTALECEGNELSSPECTGFAGSFWKSRIDRTRLRKQSSVIAQRDRESGIGEAELHECSADGTGCFPKSTVERFALHQQSTRFAGYDEESSSDRAALRSEFTASAGRVKESKIGMVWLPQ